MQTCAFCVGCSPWTSVRMSPSRDAGSSSSPESGAAEFAGLFGLMGVEASAEGGATGVGGAPRPPPPPMVCGEISLAV